MRKRQGRSQRVGDNALHRLSLWLSLAAITAPLAAAPQVSLVVDPACGSPARIALGSLQESLKNQGITWDEMPTASSADGTRVIIVAAPAKSSALPAEALRIHRSTQHGKETLELQGGDPLGLAYAVYDVAERIGWNTSANPFALIRETVEKPAVRNRAISTYTMQQAYFEQRLFDENYWKSYFDLLVRSRFNSFTFIFGYESSGFLAPPYPWFLNLPEFPQVKADGVTTEQQTRYVTALNRMIELAHERGLTFTLGIWDHIYGWHTTYYTQHVWDHLPLVDGVRPPWPVLGLDATNLVAYTPPALRKFLELVPHLDGVQFRMHGESGLNVAGMREFWEPVFQLMAREHPEIRFDARAKNVPRDLIDTAIQDGVPLRIATKYFLEQVPLPFHLASPRIADQFNSRASYFDMLRYPKTLPVLWQEWTSGTTRILWWGDPEFTRRFAASTHLYDGDGFEVAEPLATKMASEPHDLAPVPIYQPGHRYGTYEFERYWPFFRAFGRFGYDPASPADAWELPFTAHFGAAGPALRRGLERASWILPHVIEYCMPDEKYATTRGWPERQRWDDLPVYAAAASADPTLFASMAEEATLRLKQETTCKMLPSTLSGWFHAASVDVLSRAEAAERLAGSKPAVELVTAVTDLKILAWLAEYHSRRIQAGIAYALYHASGDRGSLDEAIRFEREAVGAWRGIVQAAGEVYADNLALGLPLAKNSETPREDMTGHWRDELPRFAAELTALATERKNFTLPVRRDPVALSLRPHGLVAATAAQNGTYEVAITVKGPVGPMQLQAGGRAYSEVFSVPAGASVQKILSAVAVDGRLSIGASAATDASAGIDAIHAERIDPRIATVPKTSLRPGQNLVVEATVAGLSPIRQCSLTYGDAPRGFTTVPLEPMSNRLIFRVTVLATQLGPTGTEYFLEAVDADGRRSRYPAQGRIHVVKTSDTTPPAVRFEPVTSARAKEPLKLVVQAEDPSGVAQVRVRYRSVTQFQDYSALELLPTGRPGEYSGVIPGENLDPQYDFMYFIEAVDTVGNGAIYPDMEKTTPYVVVRLHS